MNNLCLVDTRQPSAPENTESRTLTFFTDTGHEVPSVTRAEMRQIERLAVEEMGLGALQLMEQAGLHLAGVVLERLRRGCCCYCRQGGGAGRKARVALLAGTDWIGGAGIVAARHLANRSLEVSLCIARGTHASALMSLQRRTFRYSAGKEVSLDILEKEAPDFIVDALCGCCAGSAPKGMALRLVRWANQSQVPVLSLDVPTGIDATTGQALGDFVKPRWTLTLALPKAGLAPELTGKLMLADLGIPVAVYRRVNISYTAQDERFVVPLVCRVSATCRGSRRSPDLSAPAVEKLAKGDEFFSHLSSLLEMQP